MPVVFCDMSPPVAASFLTGCEFVFMPGPVPASLVGVIDLLCVFLFLRLGGLLGVAVVVVVVVVVIHVEENVVCFCPVYIRSGCVYPLSLQVINSCFFTFKSFVTATTKAGNLFICGFPVVKDANFTSFIHCIVVIPFCRVRTHQ